MSPPVVIVAQHHEVLEAWAGFRCGCQQPPAVLTFDHHNDTLPAFLRTVPEEGERQRRLTAADFRIAATIREAQAHLRHDEHLDFALKTGIVSRSVIIAHYDNGSAADERMRISADPTWPPLQEWINAPERFRHCADQVFETDFLEARLAAAEFVPEEHRGFLFDLDLDYLLTFRAATPDDPGMLLRLLSCAGMVTVSREEEWLRLLRLDREIDSAGLLARLRKFF